MLTAFRSLRVLRVFKLVSNAKSLQILLATLSRTVSDIMYFTLLLLIFLMGMALVGMELFGYRIRFDEHTGMPAKDLKDGIPPMLNFDNFINAFVTVFVLMTKQE